MTKPVIEDAWMEESAESWNTEAIRILLENQAQFKGFLRKHLPSEQAAEDLLQHSLMKAFRSSAGLSETEKATAWFYRILRNALTDYYRARASEKRRQDDLQNDIEVSGQGFHPAPDEEIKDAVCACMGRLVPTLKPEYGDLIRRIDLDGEEPARVAQDAGITYNNLMVRLHRARQALKRSLEKSCGACTTHGCLDCTCVAGGEAGPGGGRSLGRAPH